MANKTNTGWFFEDYSVGQVFNHSVPRTITAGERAIYQAAYPARHALYSSNLFAEDCGLPESPLTELAAFHIVFGKTVPDISLNAVANLGYAEGLFLKPVFVGDTLRSVSEIIGLKQNSNKKTGVVWVRTSGFNQQDEKVIQYVRWVMVRKRNYDSIIPETIVPTLKSHLDVEDLLIPKGLNFKNYNFELSGDHYCLGDYSVGEKINHVDGVTIEDAEHMMATRIWQNTAKVHFDITQRSDQTRLVYGGHIISLARSLSFNGLANAQLIAAINSGSHVNPCKAGDTVTAWSEILDISQTASPSIGAIRLRLVALKDSSNEFDLYDLNGLYKSNVLLDLDYWAFIPT
jgi:2-methylfumaryl-CoA hydratase